MKPVAKKAVPSPRTRKPNGQPIQVNWSFKAIDDAASKAGCRSDELSATQVIVQLLRERPHQLVRSLSVRAGQVVLNEPDHVE